LPKRLNPKILIKKNVNRKTVPSKNVPKKMWRGKKTIISLKQQNILLATAGATFSVLHD